MAIKSDITQVRARLRLLVIVIVLVVVGVWIWQQNFRTYHFAVVEPGVLYRDGLRSMPEFLTACHKGDIDTIIRLIDDVELLHEPFATEQTFCFHSHLHMYNILIPRGGWPTNDQIDQFFKVMDTARQKHRPAIVHCAQGVRRTGMMVAAYQISQLHYSKDQAKAAILTFGHSEKTADDIRTFIDVYDPQTRHLTTMPSTQPSLE